MTIAAGTAEGTLYHLADSAGWGGIVFADGLGRFLRPVCDDDGYPSSVHTPATLEVLDDAGAVVPCIDSLGNAHPR